MCTYAYKGVHAIEMDGVGEYMAKKKSLGSSPEVEKTRHNGINSQY